MNSTLAHQIWLTLQEPEYKRFLAVCANPYDAQTPIFKRYIRENTETEFGVAHRFDTIHSYQDFVQNVPIQEYRDFEKWISRVADGKENVLTKAAVTGFEETSGTEGFSKLIPYTAGLKAEFERGVSSWLVALA